MTQDLSSTLADTLDAALDRLQAGEPLPIILARYPALAEDLLPLLKAAASSKALQTVEMPAPEARLADRNAFLGQIAEFRGQAVSPGPLARLKGWIAHSLPWLAPQPSSYRKEQRRMSVLLAKIVLAASLAFGSTGGALAMAANNSLPGTPLYPVKLGIEDVRLNLTTNPADQSALHLSLAQTRAQEIEQVTLAGGVPDEATLARLQAHLNAGLDLAAQLSDQAMQSSLTQAQQMIQAQEQALTQARAGAAGPAQEPLQKASRYLNQAGQEVETGLRDPQAFRGHHHEEGRPPEGTPLPTPTPMPTPTGSPEPMPTCTSGDCPPPGDQHRHGPQPGQPGPMPIPTGSPEPTPTCPTSDCTPPTPMPIPTGSPVPPHPCPTGNCPSPGPMPTPAGTPKPMPTCPTSDCTPPTPPATPTPCSNGDCQPPGDQNQYGPQPEQPGPGAPGGNPDGTCTDCQPAGDQNQHGSPPPEQPSAPSDSGSSGGRSGGSSNGGGRH